MVKCSMNRIRAALSLACGKEIGANWYRFDRLCIVPLSAHRSLPPLLTAPQETPAALAHAPFAGAGAPLLGGGTDNPADSGRTKEPRPVRPLRWRATLQNMREISMR